MSEFKWTEEQRRAISCEKPGEILVSAAAGSGKTAVLTQRILELGLDNKVSPEELAVMTFTEKAAANMKKGIEERLEKALTAVEQEEEPEKALTDAEREEEREKLIHFRNLLPLAQISTIHSFCLRLIREYQNELEEEESILSGMRHFSVFSGQEAEMLLEDALDQILAEIYSALSAAEEGGAAKIPEISLLAERSDADWLRDFARLQELFASGGEDRVLRERVMEAHAFLRSLPDYEKWCRESLADLSREAEDFLASDTALYYLGRLDRALEQAMAAKLELENAPFYLSVQGESKLTKEKEALLEYVPIFTRGMQELSETEGKERWNEAVRLGRSLQNWKALTTRGNEEKLAFYEFFNRNFAPLLALLNSSAASPTVRERFGIEEDGAFWLCAEEIERAARAQLPLAARFLELVLQLDRRYAELKRKRRSIDFSDLEHTALLICRKPEIGESLRRRYREIMIDEYQDSSPLQEAIIQAIASERVYMVGDIKQSIYRFRHAEPRLFASKLESFAPAENERRDAPGHYLLLNKNFRSHPELIAGINRFFRSFLRKETGEIDYDETQELVPGLAEEKFPERRLRERFSLHFVTEGEEKAEARLFPEEEKVLAVLPAVRQLRREGFEWGEIAILGRTHEICSACLDILLGAGIPAVIGSARKFLDTPELRLLEQWTRLIGNALQDLPLTAVLRSPLHGQPFRENELLQIAREPIEGIAPEELAADGGEEPFFFRRFIQYSRTGSDERLRARCATFLETLREWRRDARSISLSRLLTRVLEQSGWIRLLSRLPYGEERVRDVENFIRLAENFERNSGHDPMRFARKLSKLREKKIEIDGWDKVPEGGNSVRIMTTHSSKGLEFPAVIYPRAERRNTPRSPGKEAFILDAEGGMAAHYASEEGLIQSLRALRLKEEIRFADRAEDYRLLYVCLTRAIERVIVLGNGKPNFLEKLAESEEAEKTASARLSEETVRAANSDWELLCHWALGELPDLRERLEQTSGGREEDLNFRLEGDLLSFSVHTRAALLDSLSEEAPAAASAAVDLAAKQEGISLPDPLFFPETPEEEAKLSELLRDELPGSDLLLIPSKLTVSELGKRNIEASESRRVSVADENTERYEDVGERPLYVDGLAEMALTFRRPEEEGAAPALRGAAFGSFLHRLLQHLPVSTFFTRGSEPAPPTPSEFEEAYRAFIREEMRLDSLAPEEEQQARAAQDFIYGFLQSELARELCAAERAGAEIWREIPFTLSIPAPGLPEESGEITLVQGMIDLFFQSGEGLILVDYKSDSLRGSQAERDAELRRRYSTQMAYYREAVRRIYGREAEKTLLWVIRENRLLEV